MWNLPNTYLGLEDYGMFIGLAENALFGIVCQDDPLLGCDNVYWNHTDRFLMIKAIQQAEKALTTYLKFPMMRTYFCDERYRFDGCDISLRRGKIIALGAKVEEEVQLNVPTGVAVFAEEYELEVAVDFEECGEVVVYYPGQTRWEIKPTRVFISGGIATITIPRWRLLKPEFFIDLPKDDTSARPTCEDANNFLETVDVWRRFPDAAQAVTFVWNRKSCGCRSSISCEHMPANPGEVTTQTGSGVIIDARLGLVRVEPATFNTETGVFDSATWILCHAPDSVLMNYYAGIFQDCDGNCPEETDAELVRAIIALAHSTLPRAICGCEPQNMFFMFDHMIPTPDDGPTIFSPFGISRGQNLAWQIVKRNAMGWGGLLA